MYPRLISQIIRHQWRSLHNVCFKKHFHATTRVAVVKPFLMADIGEGITECEIIQWFVEPEARVEEWDKLCEVTSDKASVEITSRFAGVIKKLHYEPGEMAKVGKPLVDIDTQEDSEDQETSFGISASNPKGKIFNCQTDQNKSSYITNKTLVEEPELRSSRRLATLATPSVRFLTKELNVKIDEVSGTGKDGRVLKEDVYQYVKQRDKSFLNPTSENTALDSSSECETSKEKNIPFTSYQYTMFKNMTKSLTIPHFLYADEVDFNGLSELRGRLNNNLAKNPINIIRKLSFLPFIIKAMSIALIQYPALNSKININDITGKPSIVLRSQHNIGIAMDTPSGLLVPVIKNVSSLTVINIASELARLQNLALSGKLKSQDLSGGTITVSNIGSIGGTYVSPVIIENEVAILGVGKIRIVPAFSATGDLVKKQVCNFSWSADHRVIDGATLARAAEVVRELLEDPAGMILHLT